MPECDCYVILSVYLLTALTGSMVKGLIVSAFAV